jgi:PAS domain S-box-containing protein
MRSPRWSWSTLPDGYVEFLNRRCLDYTGLSLGEARGWGWDVAVHPDDLYALTDRWRALLASGEGGEMEARVRRHDGEYRWFLFRAEPVRDDHGDIVKWYGANIPILMIESAPRHCQPRKNEPWNDRGGALLMDILESLCETIDA